MSIGSVEKILGGGRGILQHGLFITAAGKSDMETLHHSIFLKKGFQASDFSSAAEHLNKRKNPPNGRAFSAGPGFGPAFEV